MLTGRKTLPKQRNKQTIPRAKVALNIIQKPPPVALNVIKFATSVADDVFSSWAVTYKKL